MYKLVICFSFIYLFQSAWAYSANPYLEKYEYFEKESKSLSIEKSNDAHLVDLGDKLTHKLSEKLKNKGIKDPHFPHSIKTNPAKIALPDDFREALEFTNETVSIEEITGNKLDSLSDEMRVKLYKYLSTIKMQILWKDKDGRRHSGKDKRFTRMHWDKTNATAALAFFMGMKGETEKFVEISVCCPDAIMFELHGKAGSIMNANMVAQILVRMISQMSNQNSRQVASSAGNVAQVYIQYWAEKDSDQLVWALTTLVLETTKFMQESQIIFSLKKKGILLGSLLAGALLHARMIKSKDEQRLWLINSISNLAWAATTLIGTIPIAGSIAAAVAGTLSIAAVVWGVVYNKIGVRDFTPKIREIEGHIEFSALEIAEAQNKRESIVDILETLAWMRGALHINGLSD